MGQMGGVPGAGGKSGEGKEHVGGEKKNEGEGTEDEECVFSVEDVKTMNAAYAKREHPNCF